MYRQQAVELRDSLQKREHELRNDGKSLNASVCPSIDVTWPSETTVHAKVKLTSSEENLTGVDMDLLQAVTDHYEITLTTDEYDRNVILIDNGRFETVPVPTKEQQIQEREQNLIRHYPEISRKAVRTLAEEYDSPEEVRHATASELQELPNIGQKTAARVAYEMSNKLRSYIRSRDGVGMVIAMEDDNGVLQLREEALV